MVDICPTCQRALPDRYLDLDAQRIWDILLGQSDGYIYKGQRGTWHITRLRGKVDPRLVKTMLITNDLHDYYKGQSDCAYTLISRPQVDLEALKERRAARKFPMKSRNRASRLRDGAPTSSP